LLENKYDVTHVTQNVSDLLERVGCSKILHLHGELIKVRASILSGNVKMVDTIVDIGYSDVNIGDICSLTNSE